MRENDEEEEMIPELHNGVYVQTLLHSSHTWASLWIYVEIAFAYRDHTIDTSILAPE